MLEEDIKILETFKKRVEYVRILCFGLSDEEVEEIGKEGYLQKVKQAIENLINRNKELEEENIHWKGKYHLENRKYIKLHMEKIDAPIIEATEEMLKQYIPKLKVKEKIEELKEEYKDNYTNRAKHKVSYAIKILQELLD